MATDYSHRPDCSAMAGVKGRIGLWEGENVPMPAPGHLLTLVNALHAGMLKNAQQKIVQALRTAILALAEREATFIAKEPV